MNLYISKSNIKCISKYTISCPINLFWICRICTYHLCDQSSRYQTT